MKPSAQTPLPPSAERLLQELAAPPAAVRGRRRIGAGWAADIESLIAADLVARQGRRLEVTATGRAHLARLAAARQAGRDGALDPFRAQHLEEVPATEVATAIGAELAVEAGGAVRANAAESPLAWLARRKGRDGAPLISPAQLQAGERLRAEFTRAQLMPRVTANWAAAVAQSRRGGGNAAANLTESVVAARQRLRRALEAVGPEFSGLLLDVCCFLKGLDDVERERCWPARSAKVVLQLGLDRLARHYGLTSEARGRASAPLRAWSAAGEEAAAADGL